MQANDIFLSKVPAPKSESSVSPKKQSQSSSKDNFANTLQEAGTSIKQKNIEKKSEKSNKDNRKISQQDRRGGQQAKGDTLAKKCAGSKNKEDISAVPSDPQDTLELTKLVNGIPIIITTNVPEVQHNVEVMSVGLANNFSAALASVEKAPINFPINEPLDNILPVSNNEPAEVIPAKLTTFVEIVSNTQDSQLEQHHLLSANNKDSIVNQESGDILLRQHLNHQRTSITSQVTEDADVNTMEHQKTATLTSQISSFIANSVIDDSESGTVVEESVQMNKQDVLKDFWQNLKGKLEINENKGITTLLTQQQTQQQDKNTGQENTFTQLASLTDQSNNATARNILVDNFHHTMKNLDKNELLQQVIQKVQVDLKPGQTEMRMNLKPEHLGQLHLKLVVEDGKVTAQFLTNNQNVKETLENNLAQLRQSLQEQGIRVEKLSVLIGGGNLHFNQGRKEETFTGNQKQGKNWRKVSVDDYDERIVGNVTTIQNQIISDDGVDYMA